MSLLKSASTVSLLTLVSRITGLVRDLLMASTFGVSVMTDAFWVAFRIPNMLRRMFAEGAFSQAFVPVLAATRETQGEAATQRLIDAVASVLCAALVLTCVLGIVGAPWVVYAMAAGLERHPQGFDVAVTLTRWMFPYIAFMALVALGAGVLNTWKRFAVPAVTPVLLNVAMIGAAALVAPRLQAAGIEPIYAMAGGVMLGGVLQLAAIAWALRRLGVWPRLARSWGALREAWQQEQTRRIVRLMGPALLGVSVAQISLLINTQIASHLAVGSVTWLNSASLLMEFPTALLGVALGVVLMPQLAAAKAAQDQERFSHMIDWGLRLVVLLGLPSAVALLTFAEPLVATLFHNGAFTAGDVERTAVALRGYGVGLLGLVAVKVLTPGYYASHNVKAPARIAVAVLCITQVFNAVLVPWLAHAGLALALGLGGLVNALWLLVGLVRTDAYRPQPGWGLFALQVLAGCALLALFLTWSHTALAWVALQATPWLRLGYLLAAVLAGVALYLGSVWAAGVDLRAMLRR